MKAQHHKSKRVKFKPTHSIYPSNVEFDSWTDLVEYTLDLAVAHVELEFETQVDALAKEMLDSVEELPCP